MVARELKDLEAVLGYQFQQPERLEQALTHASVRHEQKLSSPNGGVQPGVEDNERMEFLGDAIVGLVVAELLYRRYPELDEGELTRLRAALVSRRHLGQVGLALDLGAYLRLGKAEERNGGRSKTVLLANCVEAIVAALYLEGDTGVAAEFVERLVVAPYVVPLRAELQTNRSIGDYKTALQELLQARHAAQPEYALKAETGPDHRKRFVVEVRVRAGEALEARAHGEASTKKRAEQEAARLAYERLTEAHLPGAQVSAIDAAPGQPQAADPSKPGAPAKRSSAVARVHRDVKIPRARTKPEPGQQAAATEGAV